MGVLESKLIVSLIDRVTAPSRAINASLSRLNEIQARNAARMNAVRSKMIDTGVIAYGLARAITAPIRAATEFETKLEDIGQKLNEPVAGLPLLGRGIRQVARDTTQSASAIAEGMDVLAGMGASKEDALALLNPIGRAATAYNAEISDLSQAGYAALSNLKVPALEFGKALDAMAQAGKAGAFELKDMAQYFPSLGAAYQGLNQKGVPAVADLAAALQIVRKGAGDSAEAATNLGNILQKIYAPRTLKAFSKMGVNLRKEMAKATKKGMTPIEAIADITNRVLKGDLSRLGELFEDSQVQKGLRPLIQNIEEYRKIRAEALAAQGVVEEDYERRLQTGALATKRWQIAMEALGLSIGNALLPALTSLANDIIPIVNRMSDWAEQHPELTRAITGTAAALVGLRVAALAAQFSLLWMKGGVISAAIGGMRLLAGAFAPVTSALRLMRVALIGTGIGAALLAIGAAGEFIYNNWEGIKSMFAGMAEGFRAGIGPLMPILQPVVDIVSRIYTAVSVWLGPLNASNQAWREFGATIGGSVASGINSIAGAIQSVIGWFQAAIDKAYAFANAIKAAVTWGGGGGADMPATDAMGNVTGARASGGPVRRGSTYLVGEKGPELFSPGRSGMISPHAAYAAARAGSEAGSYDGGRRSATINNYNQITINGAGGNLRALADAVADRIADVTKSTAEAAFGASDGGL